MYSLKCIWDLDFHLINEKTYLYKGSCVHICISTQTDISLLKKIHINSHPHFSHFLNGCTSFITVLIKKRLNRFLYFVLLCTIKTANADKYTDVPEISLASLDSCSGRNSLKSHVRKEFKRLFKERI